MTLLQNIGNRDLLKLKTLQKRKSMNIIKMGWLVCGLFWTTDKGIGIVEEHQIFNQLYYKL